MIRQQHQFVKSWETRGVSLGRNSNENLTVRPTLAVHCALAMANDVALRAALFPLVECAGSVG